MVEMPSKLRRSVALAAIVVSVAGCSGKGQDPNAVSNVKFGNNTVPGAAFFSPDDRSTVHAVRGETLQGSPLDLSTYRGKYVVVNYWSSTCVPCSAEADGFESLSRRLASQGVQFVGIDVRDNRAQAINFERGHHVTYPSLFDPTDAYLLSFPAAVPSTTPFTIVIDPDGGIAAKIAGGLDFTELRAFLRRAIAPQT